MFTAWTSSSNMSGPARKTLVGDVRLDIPAKTLAKVAVAALIALAAARLVMAIHQVILMGFVAALLAVILSSFVDWLQRIGVGRGVGALIALFTIVMAVGGVVWVTVPPLIRELHDLFENLPVI